MQSYSHKQQILKLLEEAGDEGCHSFDLLSITPRNAARILDLKKDGYNIVAVREKRGRSLGSRYFIK
jgi:hypothetical protein